MDTNKINWGFLKARKEQGFTLEELNRRTGITTSYLSLFSNGRFNLKPEQIEKLAIVLNVSVEQIAGNAEVCS